MLKLRTEFIYPELKKIIRSNKLKSFPCMYFILIGNHILGAHTSVKKKSFLQNPIQIDLDAASFSFLPVSPKCDRNRIPNFFYLIWLSAVSYHRPFYSFFHQGRWLYHFGWVHFRGRRRIYYFKQDRHLLAFHSWQRFSEKSSDIVHLSMVDVFYFQTTHSFHIILFNTSTGMVKPIFWDCVDTAVLMPITFPFESRSGPPELPGLIAASVWMTPSSRSMNPSYMILL